MKVTAAVAFLFAAVVSAAPNTLDTRSSVCPDGLLFSIPQCCATNALGLLGLDCEKPSKTPKDVKDFKSLCGKAGKNAGCCAIPAAGQGVLCNAV